MFRFRYAIFLFSMLFFLSCDQKTPDQKRVPVLEVEGKFLYTDQIQEVIPPGIGGTDSLEIADSYIRQWVTDVLLYENAKRNITDKDEIERLLDDYRKSLTIHQYQQKLIQQRLPREPTEAELREFYDNFPDQFRMKENMLKGIFLVVPKGAPRLANVRAWVQSGNTKSLEQIEKYSIQNALSYDYFGERWVPLTELMRKMPMQLQNPGDYFSSGRFYEVSDSAKHYMLGVKSVLRTGDPEPFEIAKDRITSIIMNKMKSDFIDNFQNELYHDAVESGTVTFFKK